PVSGTMNLSEYVPVLAGWPGILAKPCDRERELKMNRRGITRATRPTPEQDAEIVRLYRREGYGIQTVAQQPGLSHSRVWEPLQRKKVRKRSRGYRHPPPLVGRGSAALPQGGQPLHCGRGRRNDLEHSRLPTEESRGCPSQGRTTPQGRLGSTEASRESM